MTFLESRAAVVRHEKKTLKRKKAEPRRRKSLRSTKDIPVWVLRVFKQ